MTSKEDGQPTYLECQVKESAESKSWVYEGKVVFAVNANGTLHDLRHSPPFLPMSPCPYCGATGSKVTFVGHHDPLKHIQRAEWVGDKKSEKV